MKSVERLFKNKDSRFLEVECKYCHNKQIIFNKATTIVRCNTCGKKLAIPTGGKAKILTKIISVGDENNKLHTISSMQNSENLEIKYSQPKTKSASAKKESKNA